MADIGGYAIITGPAGIVEMDTITCGHCNAIRHRKPKPGGGLQTLDDISVKCLGCMKRICRRCAAQQRCEPLEKQIAGMERAVQADRQRSRLFDALG